MPATCVYSFTKYQNGLVRPLVPIIVTNPDTKQQLRFMALLDTGADVCCFPEFVATGTGHILKHKDVITTENRGIGGKKVKNWKHTFRIDLISPDLKKSVWKSKKILVDCVDHNKTPPLLGYAEFLSHFRITFNYKTNKIIIELP